MKTILLILTLTISAFVSSQEQHYCGKILADTMRLVCDSMDAEKRSQHSKPHHLTLQDLEDEGTRVSLKDLLSKGPGSDLMRNLIEADYHKEHHGFNGRFSKNSGLAASEWTWIAPRQARAMETVRGKRQIVEECCYKGCSIDELMTYC